MAAICEMQTCRHFVSCYSVANFASFVCHLLFLLLHQQRGTDAHHQYRHDEEQRGDGVYLHPLMHEHLHTDEHQQHANARLEVAELVGDGGEEEEHGAQAQDGEDVGEEHHIGVERHGEDGGDAVEGEDEVAELDDQHRDEEGREQPSASLAQEELVALKLRVHPACLGEEPHQGMFLHVDLLLLVAVHIHFDATVHQEHAEEEQYPVEAADDGGTEEDEDEAQHDGTEDAPVEHVLVFVLAHAEGGEDHHHHEEVVHRQGLLDEIARDVGDGHVVAVLLQARFEVVGVELQVSRIAGGDSLEILHVLDAMHHVAVEPQEDGEEEGETYPDARPCARLLDGNHVCLAVDDQHV